MSSTTQKSDLTPQDIEEYRGIGKLLRQAREQMRMPIDQASRLLHIRVRYLEALEEGKLSELPGLTYTKGYLQSYAVFLGLDKDEILRRFEEMEASLARKNFYFPQVFSKEKTPSKLMVWGSLGLAAAAYVLWSLVAHPDGPRLSQVEKLPPPVTTIHISESMLRDVTCLRFPDQIYPPCTFADTHVFSMTPTRGYHVTVMDFGSKDDALKEPEESDSEK